MARRHSYYKVASHGTGLEVHVPKDLLDYHVDTGYLLAYLAEIGKSVIEKRTASQRDVDGEFFERYKTRYDVERDQAGNIIRDAKGRWRRVVVRDGSTPVLLRSLADVQDGKRMIEGIRVVPKFIKPTAKTAYIKPGGGRGGVSHALRANTVQTGRSNKGGNVPREFMGLSPFDWDFILSRVRESHVLAFIKKLNDRQKSEGRKRALRAAERQIKRTLAAAKRAERTAAQMHKKHLQDLRRLGIQEGETAREAYKRRSRERRIEKTRKKAARKGSR